MQATFEVTNCIHKNRTDIFKIIFNKPLYFLIPSIFAPMEYDFSLAEIEVVAKAFWEQNRNNKIFCFYGEMGAGKTTFIQAFCRAMGVTGNMSSPTFSIINEYTGRENKIIYHMDLYRLKDVGEAIAAGVENSLYSNETCLVEWPQIIENILPEKHLKLSLTSIGENRRMLKIL